MILNNFFTSGWIFDEDERDLKSRYQMVNIALVLSSFALIYGIIGNTIRDISGFIPLEIFLICMNMILFFVLRNRRELFEIVATVMTVQFTFLFLFLVYVSEPSSLKHIWLFTYPIILLYFQKIKYAVYWLTFIITMLIISPIQGFIDVHYSFFQVTYLSFVLVVVSVIIYFYQIKMDEAKELILEQQKMLKEANIELAKQVKELKLQDKLLTAQSKQAVMGEMISMIAHQWRQPLSTITLHISNLHFKIALGSEVDKEHVDKTLSDISDSIIYLSDTIDDFQTYFRPNKESSEIELGELIQRAINFVLPRVKGTHINLELLENANIIINTHINEVLQVILNILNNAIDALNETKVKEPSILINFQSIDENVIVNIKDNAKGVDEKNIEHLFEPYFSTKGKNGTGLGLYMSQMIMQKQFGTKIEVQTSKNGSTFSVKIPKNIL